MHVTQGKQTRQTISKLRIGGNYQLIDGYVTINFKSNESFSPVKSLPV